MMKVCISSLITCMLLTSCTTYQLGDHHDAYCNELKSQLIFNGGTSIARKSEIQTAEQPLIERNYDRTC